MPEQKHIANGPGKTAAILCDEKSLPALLRELLRQKSWESIITESDINSLKSLRHNNKIDMFMIVDSSSSPASESLRVLFQDARCRLTPTMIFTANISATDVLIYERLFQVTTCPKPITFGSFSTCLDRLIDQWNQPAMVVLRKLAEISDNQNQDKKLEILDKLLADPNAMPIALAAQTQIMLSRHLTKEAENKLLSLCKITPVNPATLAICAWFYLSVKMPVHAMRFLEKLRNIAPESVLLNLDLASAQIASGEITKALNATHEWARRNPGNEAVEERLARLLVADGKKDLAESYGLKRARLQKCTESWAALETKDEDQPHTLKREQNAS
jgi:hypothetical protein